MVRRNARRRLRSLTTAALTLAVVAVPAIVANGADAGAAAGSPRSGSASSVPTASPIKHLVVILGENHTFDNVFATYRPKHGETVDNLLSEGIVTASGRPGPNASAALQLQATNHGAYTLQPPVTGPYATLPEPDTTSATGQPQDVPDARFPAQLANAPFQITKYVPYENAYVGDPIHRFYQMWQQVHEGRNDLFTWTANTAGDDNGAMPPDAIHQGGLAMGYYNVAQGDAPVLKYLADHYAMSDNYHQAVMGGTGTNHIAIGTADDAYYQDATGHPTTPPGDQIENPNAKPGTNNNFTQDGYSGGTFSNCSDTHQPGVGAVLGYEHTLPYPMFRNGDCKPGAYYVLNNYDPGYTPDGKVNTEQFQVPVQHDLPTIGDELSGRGVSWKYYGEGWNGGKPTSDWCGICDPFQYVGNYPQALAGGHVQDFSNFLQDAASDDLPAVSFVKPGNDDGHPSYSTLSQFEGFTSQVVNSVMSRPDLFKSTAILVTFDEGGGYYDSGYVQPVSFFGDGPRVPMIAVSPYTKSGHVSHAYNDHASIVKFIERNWNLSTLSARSWDNLPDPRPSRGDQYVPANAPAVGDLFDLFDFHHARTTASVVPPGGHGPARRGTAVHNH